MGRKIRQAAVIGSGVMGGGIAALLAGAGVNTLLLDIVPPDLNEEEKENPAARNRIVQGGLERVKSSSPPVLMHPRDAERIRIGNLEDDFNRLADCDWIVEVVVENLGIKRDLLKRLEGVRKADAIVTTNTSGIPLKAMSKGLGDAFLGHFMGTHFFNPVRYMKMLELIPGPATLPEVLTTMAGFGERVLGKGIVWAKDTPNFIGNRIGMQGIMLTLHALGTEGIRIEEADALLGRPLGRPKSGIFRTCDMVGLDVVGFVAANTRKMATEDERRDLFELPGFVLKMIEKKLLGGKTGAGFYKKAKGPDGEKTWLVINPETLSYEPQKVPDFPCLGAAKQAGSLPEKMRAIVYGDDPGARFAWKVVAESLIYAARRILEISDAIVDIDNAMRWGFNFDLGPFETWDAIGLERSVSKMADEGLQVPDRIHRMLDAGNSAFYKIEDGATWCYDFASEAYRRIPLDPNVIQLGNLKASGRMVLDCPSASLVDLGDGVYCCEVHTRMNALNEEVVNFLHECLDYVEENGAGLVVGNQGKGTPGTFSAGADLLAMAGMALQGKSDAILAMAGKFQDAMQRFRYSPFPVVAAPYGFTLAGGCELCLGADRLVAHAELYMGLVETGVGLLPSGGGCLNLWKKISGQIPELVGGVDLARLFEPVFMNIAMARVSSSAADARALGFLGPLDRIVFNLDHLIAEAKREVLRMLSDGYRPPVKRKLKVMGDTALGMVDTKVSDMQLGGFISEYDALLARRVAQVVSGGEARYGSEVSEEVILRLEREAFVALLKEEKTHARVEHMLRTGKPLRN
jgi:3-hydroxyacyl-CoA dehydrogenase